MNGIAFNIFNIFNILMIYTFASLTTVNGDVGGRVGVLTFFISQNDLTLSSSLSISLLNHS